MNTEIQPSDVRIVPTDSIIKVRLYMNEAVELMNELFKALPSDKALELFPKVSGFIDLSTDVSNSI